MKYFQVIDCLIYLNHVTIISSSDILIPGLEIWNWICLSIKCLTRVDNKLNRKFSMYTGYPGSASGLQNHLSKNIIHFVQKYAHLCNSHRDQKYIHLMDNSFKCYHDDVIKWKHFPCHWPFVRGIQRSPVNSPHKGRWRGALMFSLICARLNSWVNSRYAGDLRRYQDIMTSL